MDHEAARSVKAPPFISNGQDTVSNVDKLRGYYDGARNRLKSYLGREDGEFLMCFGCPCFCGRLCTAASVVALW